MSALGILLDRAGLASSDQAAAVLTEADAVGLLAVTGPGESALALRTLVYMYLIQTPPESALARAFAAPRKEQDAWCR